LLPLAEAVAETKSKMDKKVTRKAGLKKVNMVNPPGQEN